MSFTKKDIWAIVIILITGLCLGLLIGFKAKKCEPCTIETIDIPNYEKIIADDIPIDSLIIEWKKRNGTKY